MSIVQIDVEDLRAKSGAVEGSIGRLQAEVSTMEANLRQLQDTWRGQAAAGPFSRSLKPTDHTRLAMRPVRGLRR